MRLFQGILLLAFLGAVLAFSWQNNQVIDVRFFNSSIAAPTFLVFVAVYLLGMISGWTVVAFIRRSLRGITKRDD